MGVWKFRETLLPWLNVRRCFSDFTCFFKFRLPVNFYADPFAVREVLGLDKISAPHFPLNRFVLCPLDLTTRHTLSLETYTERVDPLFKDSGSPSREDTKPVIQHFTSSILERTREVMSELGIYELQLHDPVAVWCAIANPPEREESTEEQPRMQTGWKCDSRIFDIERSDPGAFHLKLEYSMLILGRTGELTRGMLVIDRRRVGGGTNRVEERNKETAIRLAAARTVGVVSETPGSEVLVGLLLERIWGC